MRRFAVVLLLAIAIIGAIKIYDARVNEPRPCSQLALIEPLRVAAQKADSVEGSPPLGSRIV